MHSFSPISTQYEIESWIFPHPGVRRLQDARNPGPRREPRRHSLHPGILLTRPSREGEERARLKRGHRRWHSNEHAILHNDLNRSKEDKVGEQNAKTGSLKTMVERSRPSDQSQLCESMYVLAQTVRSSGSRSGGTGVGSSELLGAVSSSHQPYKQLGTQTQSTRLGRLPLAQHGSTVTQIQSLLQQPTFSHQQLTTAHRFLPSKSEGLPRSSSHKSRAMDAESEPSRGPDLPVFYQDVSSAHEDTARDWCRQDTPYQQDKADDGDDDDNDDDNDDDDEELNPALLGSLDYHSFLHGSSKAKGTSSPDTSSLPGTAITTEGNNSTRIRAALYCHNALGAWLGDKPAHESPVSRLAHGVIHSSSHQAFPETRQPIATIRERRKEALTERSGRSEALKKLPKPQLSVMTETPASLTFSTISPSSSLTTTPLLRGRTLRGIPSGPLSTISSKEVDPERLQPFIGPLLPQQPPPDQPLPQLPVPSPVKRLDPTTRPFASMAGRVDSSEWEVTEGDMRRSVERTAEIHVNQKKGKGLRKKISRFFSSDQPGPPANATTTTTYQPLSLTTSQDTERLSLSEIFDDVYNAARGSLKPGRGSQSSRNPCRNSYQDSHHVSIPGPPEGLLFPMQPEHLGAQGSNAVVTAVPNSSYEVEPPPLINHPAIKDDLETKHRLGVIGNNSVSKSAPSTTNHDPEVRGLPVSPRRPAQTGSSVPSCLAGPASSVRRDTGRERLVEEESQATITAKTPQEIDPLPAFDRTVDITWYRTAREQGGTIICSMPSPSSRFEHTLTLFVAQFAKGRPLNRFDGTKRFPYFDLPSKIRFEIVRCLFADTDTARPILLNSERQASPAWPADAFISLESSLKPLQGVLWACPRLRAEVMVVLFLTRRFHVIFSPCVRECTQPLPTTATDVSQWLFRYLHLMQDVSLEIDMTKLGFGHGWESASMQPSMKNIRELVCKFTEVLTRGPANSMGSLTIHCRRYFGYRQGPNTAHGRHGAQRYSLVGGEDDEPLATIPDQPHNYNQKAPSLPPSAAKPYSGHLRHHSDRPHRVPYVTEHQLAVASPLRALTGRVESLRMVGFSEQWTYATHLAIWPEAERNAVLDAVKHFHIDRQTPSSYTYAAPGHAVFLDYGFEHGVHRYPPLPDSEPMVCVDYDRRNGLFVELGSGNVVSVTKGGAEFLGRSTDPPTPSLISGIAPRKSASSASCESLLLVPLPMTRDKTRAMQKGTPVKAAAVLGLPGALMTSSEDRPCETPTRPRPIRNIRAETSGNATTAPPRGTRPGKIADQKSRSGSISGAMQPGEQPAKRSFHLLGSKLG